MVLCCQLFLLINLLSLYFLFILFKLTKFIKLNRVNNSNLEYFFFVFLNTCIGLTLFLVGNKLGRTALETKSFHFSPGQNMLLM